MAQIKTTDIINGQEVSAEVQKVVTALNALMKQLGSLSVQYQKTNGSTKELTRLQRENTQLTKDEIKAQKDAEAAIRKHEAERKKLQLLFDKQAAAQRQLVRSANMEIKSDADLNTKLKAQIQLRSQLNQNLPREKAMYDKLTISINHLQTAQNKANAGIKNFKNNVGNYPQNMNQAASATSKFGASMTNMVAGAVAVIAILRQMSKYVTDVVMTFAKFDYVQAQVKAISGATDEEMKKLRNTAKELGAATEKTAAEVSQLQLDLSKLGFTATEINAATNAIVKLSIATGEALAYSAAIMAGVMNAFQLPAKEAARVADVMAASFSSSALNLEKFQYSMSSVAPVANELGYSIENVTAWAAVLADSNVEASTSSAQLRNILLELNKSGMTMEEGLQKLNGSTDKMNLANEMFGKRAAPIAVILSNNIEKANELTKSFENSAGSAEHMAGIMEDTLQGDLKKAKSSVEALKISLGEGQNTGLRGVVQGFSKAIDTLTASGILTDYLDMMRENVMMMLKPFQNLFKLFGEGADAAKALSTAFAIYMKIIQFIQLPVRLLWSYLDAVTGAILGIVNAIKNFKDLKFQDVLNIVNKAIVDLLSPITDLIGMSDKVSKFFGVQVEKVKLTADEYERLNALIMDHKSIIADVKEQVKLKQETEELTAMIIEQEEVVEEANKAYKSYLDTITKINKEYQIMIQFLKSDVDLKQAAIDRDQKLFDASLEYYGKVTPEMKKMMDSYKIIVGEAEKLEKIGGLHIANETDIELIKTAAEETENYYMKMFNIMNGFDVMATKPKTFFEEMTEAAKGFGEFWEKNGKAITMTIELIGEAVSAQFDNQITELENLQDANDKYYDKLIAAREGDEAAQAQLEQKKLEKAAEIQEKLIAERRKKAIFDKAQALVDIAINTAVGISAALASIPPNPILAAAIGVTGAIQAGIVASQPLPQYKTGLDFAKEDHIGIVGDAGPELVHYPDGSSALFSKPTATFLPKFSIVDTAQETQAKLKSMEFQNNMYKFTANNDKQVKLLSTIARNTGKNGMREQDIFFIKRYAK